MYKTCRVSHEMRQGFRSWYPPNIGSYVRTCRLAGVNNGRGGSSCAFETIEVARLAGRVLGARVFPCLPLHWPLSFYLAWRCCSIRLYLARGTNGARRPFWLTTQSRLSNCHRMTRKIGSSVPVPTTSRSWAKASLTLLLFTLPKKTPPIPVSWPFVPMA